MPERKRPDSPLDRGHAGTDPLYRDQVLTTADETIAQPVIASRGWRPRWFTVIVLMTLVAVAATAIVVLNSPLMEIRSVTVAGGESVPLLDFIDRVSNHTSWHTAQLVPASSRARLGGDR